MTSAFFPLSPVLTVSAPAFLDCPGMQALWAGFTAGQGRLNVLPRADFSVLTPDAAPISLPEGRRFAACVTETGISMTAATREDLMRAMMTLCCRIVRAPDGSLRIPAEAWQDGYRVSRRMLHLCVFPETTVTALHRLLRLAAVLQYTHVVVEFWGMLRYDADPALSWPQAFDKAEIRPLLEECRALGCQPVPMFNMLGHASACRVCGGKHVVLDRFPERADLFTPDGWAWNIENPAVPALLRQVRQELYGLFGPGDYFHLGCDEPYQTAPAYRAAVPEYLRCLTEEVRAEGRQPIVWADTLLCGSACGADDSYYCAAPTADEARQLRKSLVAGTVAADWQYRVRQGPLVTALDLARDGLEVLGCPWHYGDELCRAYLDTPGLSGILVTTWHTLDTRLLSVVQFAEAFGVTLPPWFHRSAPLAELAALNRAVQFGLPLSYEDCGWQRRQAGFAGSQ